MDAPAKTAGQPHHLGHLFVTRVELHDVGLVGLTEELRLAVEVELEADNRKREQFEQYLASLTFPTTFGSNQNYQDKRQGGKKNKKNKKKNKSKNSKASEDAHAAYQASQLNYNSLWQQGYDETTSHYYYFNTETQESSWEIPSEGFRPWDALWSGLLQPTDNEHNVSNEGQQDVSILAAAGEDCSSTHQLADAQAGMRMASSAGLADFGTSGGGEEHAAASGTLPPSACEAPGTEWTLAAATEQDCKAPSGSAPPGAGGEHIVNSTAPVQLIAGDIATSATASLHGTTPFEAVPAAREGGGAAIGAADKSQGSPPNQQADHPSHIQLLGASLFEAVPCHTQSVAAPSDADLPSLSAASGTTLTADVGSITLQHGEDPEHAAVRHEQQHSEHNAVSCQDCGRQGSPPRSSPHDHSQEPSPAQETAHAGQLDAGAAAGPREHIMMDATTSAYVRRLLPRNLAKYWLQRYSLFSRYDEGVQMDAAGWYSVTPEVLAAHQASRCAALLRGSCSRAGPEPEHQEATRAPAGEEVPDAQERADNHEGTGRRAFVAVDAFCGCGGNAIQLALAGGQVIATDLSAERLEATAHNASIYGAADRLDLVRADFLEAAKTLVADVVFLSPPWGGPMYRYMDIFPVDAPLEGLGLSVAELIELGHGMLPAGAGVVAAFLPRNLDLGRLAALVPAGSTWEVEHNMLNGRLKGITVYCRWD